MSVELIAIFSFGLLFISALIVIAIRFPEPTVFQYTVFRIVLALAAAGIAALVPGLLQVDLGQWIRGSGALAVFVIVYFYSPAALVGNVSKGKKRESAVELVDARLDMKDSAYVEHIEENRRVITHPLIQVEDLQPNHPFPTIDFKFINSGDAPAILTEFQLQIDEIQLDVTPDLRFSFDVNFRNFMPWGADQSGPSGDRSLTLWATNSGWGAAKDSRLVVADPILERFFSEQERTFNGDIDSGASASVLKLALSVPIDEFNALHTQLMEKERDKIGRDLSKFLEREPGSTSKSRRAKSSLQESYDRHCKGEWQRFANRWTSTNSRLNIMSEGEPTSPPAPRIPLDNPAVHWWCADELGHQHSGRSDITNGHPESLYLRADGFEYDQQTLCANALRSDVTYSVVLDPKAGAQTLKYPISRNIPASGVERFHIMIGATQSSLIKLRFAFLINGSKIIESSALDIRIKNPVGANLHHRYKDGDEMRRALLSNVTSSKHELPEGMGRDEPERLGSCPFIPDRRQR